MDCMYAFCLGVTRIDTQEYTYNNTHTDIYTGAIHNTTNRHSKNYPQTEATTQVRLKRQLIQVQDLDLIDSTDILSCNHGKKRKKRESMTLSDCTRIRENARTIAGNDEYLYGIY